ncbi:SLC13 family permease, partial [bacterium]|nr:SLC13 family permease [bacterium]
PGAAEACAAISGAEADKGAPDGSLELLRFKKGVLISVAYASSIGGIATLTGTPTNLVFAAQFPQLFPSAPTISFATWMAFALPLSLSLLLLVWGLLWYLVGSPHLPEVPRASIVRAYAELGAATFQEKVVLAHFAALALLWVTHPAWKRALPMVSDATVVVLTTLSLFMAPSRRPALCGGRGGGAQPIPACLNWEVAVKLPWGVLILLGGGFAVAGAFKSSGLSHWMGLQLLFAASWPPVLVLLLVNTFMTFATEITSNVSTCTIVLPVLAQLARALGINPLVLLVPGTISTSFAFMLPIATPPNAIAFSSGELQIVDMLRTGVRANFVGILLTTLFTIALAPVVLDASLSTSPNSLPAWVGGLPGAQPAATRCCACANQTNTTTVAAAAAAAAIEATTAIINVG